MNTRSTEACRSRPTCDRRRLRSLSHDSNTKTNGDPVAGIMYHSIIAEDNAIANPVTASQKYHLLKEFERNRMGTRSTGSRSRPFAARAPDLSSM